MKAGTGHKHPNIVCFGVFLINSKIGKHENIHLGVNNIDSFIYLLIFVVNLVLLSILENYNRYSFRWGSDGSYWKSNAEILFIRWVLTHYKFLILGCRVLFRKYWLFVIFSSRLISKPCEIKCQFLIFYSTSLSLTLQRQHSKFNKSNRNHWSTGKNQCQWRGVQVSSKNWFLLFFSEYLQ